MTTEEFIRGVELGGDNTVAIIYHDDNLREDFTWEMRSIIYDGKTAKMIIGDDGSGETISAYDFADNLERFIDTPMSIVYPDRFLGVDVTFCVDKIMYVYPYQKNMGDPLTMIYLKEKRETNNGNQN